MNAPVPVPLIDRRSARIGLISGLTAYAIWGVLPIYFKALEHVSPVLIVAQRIVWSMVALAVLVTVLNGWPAVRKAVRNSKTRATLALTSSLIAVNWMLYVYAINSGQILAGSFGYYLNPLANIVLGRLFLRETLSRRQWTAVAIAAGGVATMAAGALDTLWLSLTLCVSFATYGLLRKRVAVDSLSGLTIETVILAPVALAYLGYEASRGTALFGDTGGDAALLVATGIVSTIPLLLFTESARRLPYATVGMLQFLAPTLQFLLAVLIYDEPFTRAHAFAFAAIWVAVALYMSGMVAKRPIRS